MPGTCRQVICFHDGGDGYRSGGRQQATHLARLNHQKQNHTNTALTGSSSHGRLPRSPITRDYVAALLQMPSMRMLPAAHIAQHGADAVRFRQQLHKSHHQQRKCMRVRGSS